MGLDFGNRIVTFLSKMADSVILAALWVISSLPVFTIGASTTALYYTVHKALVRNHGYIWRTYWDAWKDNFKQATAAWLVQLVVLIIFALDIVIMRSVADQASGYKVLLYMFYVLMAALIVWIYYTIGYQARFENTLKNSLKNAGTIAFLNLPWSLLILVIFVLVVLVVSMIPILLFLLPTVQIILYDVILERIFRKYMKPEELEHELENDRLDKE
jgi:uncharacterized membrane protein YesL